MVLFFLFFVFYIAIVLFIILFFKAATRLSKKLDDEADYKNKKSD